VRPSAREFAEFNGLLCSVVEKGLPLPPTIDLMAGVVRDRSLKDALGGVARALDDGASLPDALGRYPAAFPPEYCALVRAGVESGRLAEVLRTFQIHHSMQARVRSRMTRLLLYLLAGAIVGELVLGVTLLTGRYINEFNNQLMIQMEMTAKSAPSEFIESTVESGWILLLLWPAAIGMAAAAYAIFQRYGRLAWLGYALPVWGRIQKSRDLALFCCALGLRLRSDTSIVDALRSGRDSVVNRKFRRLADQVIRRVEEGDSLASALFYVPFFPKTLAWGVSLAEENGEVPRTLDTFTGLYTSQMERNFALLNDLLTPLGVLAVGNVALLSAMMILSPLFQIIQVQQMIR
jgi:type II secretory pathway component PulF